MSKRSSQLPSAGKILYDYTAVAGVLLLTILFTCLNGNFLSVYNIRNLLNDASTLLILSVGVSFPIFLGSTDLSIGHAASLFCVITGTYVGETGNVVILYALIAGVLIGLINGILHVTFKIPAFVATLCTGNIYAVLAKILAGGGAKPIPVDKQSIISWVKLSFAGIPVLFLIAVSITVLLYVLQKWTVIGKSILAAGANETASNIMGVDVKISKVTAFCISGICAALCGVLLSLKLKSNSPTAGANLTLIAIASTAIGGTTLFGGSGSVLKTFFGVLLVIIIKNGLNLFGVDAFWTDIVFGILLISAIIMRREKGLENTMVK